MKKKLMITFCGAMLLMVGMSLGAFGASKLQEIKAYLNRDLAVRFNGELQELKDVNGNTVLPITYKGTTYLPVRAVSSLLDVPVNYDGAAKEILIGEMAGVAVKQEDFNKTLYSKDTRQTSYNGKDYKEVLYSPAGSTIKYTALSPNGKYKKLVLQIAALEKNIDSVSIKDNDNNALLANVKSIYPDSGMKKIEVDITGVKNISISVEQSSDGGFLIPLTTSYYQ
ncbi:hypothetical protein EHV15_14640 [Paenibacillus oralis]|uniref:Copper amine oxidase-like N-terminal domain-containing protein n=1 Tax=Paenibacillus oralis TaxID=2490856 RepID=A0A3P3U0Z7_9BACL|nr:hypothetical protein [Paenibacillus oralis]RRJ64031.1 hypothetical protein EHV15_14640 [Paenibacillus oralis]